MKLNNEKKYWRYLIWIFLIYYSVYYIPYFFSGLVLSGDDFKWTTYLSYFGDFNKGIFIGGWDDKSYLLGGQYHPRFLTLVEIWVRVFPSIFATNSIYVALFSLLLVSVYLFFRAWDFPRIPAFIIAILVTFSPIFHTFIRTGHVYKIFLTPCIFFAFTFVTMLFRKQRFKFCYSFLTAFFLAIGFTGADPQVFIFFSPFFFLYALGLLFVHHFKTENSLEEKQKKFFSGKGEWQIIANKLLNNFMVNRKTLFFLMLIGLMSGVMVIKTILIYGEVIGFDFSSDVRIISTDKEVKQRTEWFPPDVNEDGIQKDEDQTISQNPVPQDQNLMKWQKDLNNWYWATQWSLPKIETIDLFVPGFMGFFSHSYTEPYWGRIGQTEGWDQHRQGYQHYSLMVSYLGVFFVIFLVYGLLYTHPVVRISGGFFLILFMFLSYGKFSFVYQWLYELPGMDQLRNPNRFLQLVHFIGAIVFGFGFGHFYERIKSRLVGNSDRKPFNFFLIFLTVVLVVGFLGLVGLYSEEDQLLNYFASRFPYATASLIVSNMFFYWIKAIIFFSVACLLLHYATHKISFQNMKLWAGVILLFAFLDVYLVNIKFYNYVKPVREFEKTNFHRLLYGELPGYEQYKLGDPMDTERMFFLKEKGRLEGRYINYLFYNGELPLQLFDFRTLRRGVDDIPIIFRNYFNFLRNPDLRFLKIAGVKYIFSTFPAPHNDLELVYVDEYEKINERVFLYSLKNTLPMFYIRGQTQTASTSADMLQIMNSDSFDIDNMVMLYEKNLKQTLTEEQIASISPHPENKIRVKEKVDVGRYVLEADLKTPVILVLNNRVGNWWLAENNGEKLPHLSANYFFNGFYLTPEDKEISVYFLNPSIENVVFSFFYTFNYFFLAGVLFFMAYKRKGKSVSKKNKNHHRK